MEPLHADRIAVNRVVISAPGRSGSTLLQSMFLAACGTLTFFEPCRHSPEGDVRRDRCVQQVRRFLACDLPVSHGLWEPPQIGGWLKHPYLDANTSCSAPPFQHVALVTAACRRARLVVVKEIRLQGQLRRLGAALSERPPRGDTSTALIQLVRDPRAIIASQKRLRWWDFNLPHEMARVARHTCDSMLADAAAGAKLRRRGQIRHIVVRFEELVSNLSATAYRLYADLGWRVPHSTREWLLRTLRGQCRSHTDFEYSTCRNATSASHTDWRAVFTRRERRAVMSKCKKALRYFGYVDDVLEK